MRLDAKTIAALQLEGKTDAIFFDEDMAGFGFRLRLGAGGKLLRSWVVQYRRAGASRRLLLGSAEVLTADRARAAAKEVLAKVALGQDPAADRADRHAKDKLTFIRAVADYLEGKRTAVRPNTFAETSRYLTGGYFKPLHTMPLDTITRQDVALRIKTIERESGAATAGQARGKLSAFFVAAMQDGLVESNPTIGVRKPVTNRPRERVLSDQELAAIWTACGDDHFGKVVRLMILTACRREEIGGMRWPEFDGDTWTLPAARAKNHRAHTLPLLPMMRAILDGVPRLVSRELLFGQHSPAGFQSWDNHKRDLDRRSRVEGWQLRDIRRSAATMMADIGVQPHIVEQILNHQSGHRAGVAGIYNRSPYEREVRAALALWHDHVRSLIEGGERKVVAFSPSAS
jgi:integrase